MDRATKKQPPGTKIITWLERKAGRSFTWIDQLLLSFLLFYACAVIALPIYLFWEAPPLLMEKPFLSLLLLMMWIVFAGGYGIRSLLNILKYEKQSEVRHEEDKPCL